MLPTRRGEREKQTILNRDNFPSFCIPVSVKECCDPHPNILAERVLIKVKLCQDSSNEDSQLYVFIENIDLSAYRIACWTAPGHHIKT